MGLLCTLVLGLLLGACGSEGAVSAPDPSTSAGSPAASGGGPQRLQLRDDLLDARVVSFTVRSHDGRRVELAFTAGPRECEAARATVREGSDRVAVRLQVGRYPGAEQDCVAVARASTVTVELQAALGGRRVVPLE